MTALPGLGVLVICYLSACQAKLILPVRAPRGFNSFDHYPFDELNETLVLHIADAMAAQLLPFGYEYLVIDGGWTESKLPTGTRFNHIDEYGRPIAAPERYPSGIAWLAGQVRQRGLKLGLWTIRGVHADAVRRRTPILGAPGHTADELVDELPVGGGPNGSCLWSSSWLGVNMSHPAAQAYYASRVALLAETYEADFIKADCMMCGPCYTDEVQAFTAAVAASPRELVLSYSPGGGNSVSDGQWVAGQRGAPESGSGALGPSTQPLSSMYRVVTDFHGGWYAWGGLQQLLFIQGNFSNASLAGANSTWPDPDMLPMSGDWWSKSAEQDDRGQTIATLWHLSRAPLFYAGLLPTDETTLSFLTNKEALRIHADGQRSRPVSYQGNCTCVGGAGSCTIPRDAFPAEPCVATWASALPGADAAAAVFNLGENITSVVVHLGGLLGHRPPPADGGAQYAVTEVWSGKAIGTFAASTGHFSVTLRPHASAFYLLTQQPAPCPPAPIATYLDIFASDDCTGPPNASVELSSDAAAYPHCTRCWDRCASGANPRSFQLRGATATAALQSNCIGQFQYAGGWTDASFGGTISTSSGCHKGGASAVVLCSGSAEKMDDDLAAVCGTPTPVPANHTWPIHPFFVLDPEQYADKLGEDAEWAEKAVPYIDVPNDDLMIAYYYRWRVLRKHIAYTSDDGFLITEFQPYVPWSGTHNTIPAAAGHHLLESRWLHDPQVASDYLQLWLSGRGDPFSYSSWIGWAAWSRHLLVNSTASTSPEDAMATAVALAAIYEEKAKRYRRVTGKGVACWFQTDGSDAMEVSVSGDGCRPTTASIMWAEATAVARFARLGRNESLAQAYEQYAADTRAMLLSLHWNAAIDSFGVVPLANKHTRRVVGGNDDDDDDAPLTSKQGVVPLTSKQSARASASSHAESSSSSSAPACNLSAVRIPDEPVGVRELLGFIPWYFEGLMPPEEAAFHAQWKALFDADGFLSPWGLRTTERRHPCYNYSWAHGDCWNGPSWPYETARVLGGAANALHAASAAGAAAAPLSREQYVSMLLDYARQHTATFAADDTASPVGSGHIFENLHPDLGYWNNRQQMYWSEAPMRDMGNDYLHSTFCDLVLSGLLGIRPQSGANNTVLVTPLAARSGPAAWEHFAADHVLVRGRVLSVVWDSSGTAYGRGKGFRVLVDGEVAAWREDLGNLAVEL